LYLKLVPLNPLFGALAEVLDGSVIQEKGARVED
jgi:hypothetical protein